MSPSTLRERLEELDADMRTGEEHPQVVRGCVAEALSVARRAEEQSLCGHAVSYHRFSSRFKMTFCSTCGKHLETKENA